MKAKKPTFTTISFEPIGIVYTPFEDKYGVPRQPGLVPEARGVIRLQNKAEFKTALKKLETFSHLWLIYYFHNHGMKSWKPTVRPPRLGGDTKVGVLASRSPHRPNPIGMSVVRIEKIDVNAKLGPEIEVSGVDLLNETPLLDLKPYLPYSDSHPDADAGWAKEEIARHEVVFSEKSQLQLSEIERSGNTALRSLIQSILSIDPRLGFQKRRFPPDAPQSFGKKYGIRVTDYEIKWEIREKYYFVVEVLPIKELNEN